MVWSCFPTKENSTQSSIFEFGIYWPCCKISAQIYKKTKTIKYKNNMILPKGVGGGSVYQHFSGLKVLVHKAKQYTKKFHPAALWTKQVEMINFIQHATIFSYLNNRNLQFRGWLEMNRFTVFSSHLHIFFLQTEKLLFKVGGKIKDQ